MTTRTKIGLCVGLLVLAVGLVLAAARTRTATRVKCLSYTNGAMALCFSNRERLPVVCRGVDLMFSDTPPSSPYAAIANGSFSSSFTLTSQCEVQILTVRAFDGGPWSPTSVHVHCLPERTAARRRIGMLLKKVGIDIGSTGFVASVDLSPR